MTSQMTSPNEPQPTTLLPSIAPEGAHDTVRQQQRERIDLYKREPEAAWTIDHATTGARNRVEDGALDPLHTRVEMGHGEAAMSVPIALHRAVGGFGELPVPGDVLCAALAACTDSTIRVVANVFGIELLELEVDVRAEVDVRGTLCVSPEVPVGFQQIHTDVRLRAAEGTSPARLERLVKTAEHCCVVMRTLREGVPVTVSCDVSEGGAS